MVGRNNFHHLPSLGPTCRTVVVFMCPCPGDGLPEPVTEKRSFRVGCLSGMSYMWRSKDGFAAKRSYIKVSNLPPAPLGPGTALLRALSKIKIGVQDLPNCS